MFIRRVMYIVQSMSTNSIFTKRVIENRKTVDNIKNMTKVLNNKK